MSICIADTGRIRSESVRDQLFNLFFTTKPIDKGTALGFSISYQIVVVEKHQGMLPCRSELGKGTERWIEIPVRQSQLIVETMQQDNAATDANKPVNKKKFEKRKKI